MGTAGGGDTEADIHLWQQWLLLWLTHLVLVAHYHQSYVAYHFGEVLLALAERRHTHGRGRSGATDPLTSGTGAVPWLYRVPVVVGGMAAAMLLQASALATLYQRQRDADAATPSSMELGVAFVAHTTQLLLVFSWPVWLFGTRQMRAHALAAFAAFGAFVTAALCWALQDVVAGLLYLGSAPFYLYYMLCAFQFSALDPHALRDARDPLVEHRLQLAALERRVRPLEARARAHATPTVPPPPAVAEHPWRRVASRSPPPVRRSALPPPPPPQAAPPPPPPREHWATAAPPWARRPNAD